MYLLNKIEQWTQGGPTAGNLYQDPWEWGDYDVSELVSAESIQELMAQTGLFQGEEWGDWSDPESLSSIWEAEFGGYLTPYDPTQESLIGKSFLDTMKQQWSETYSAMGAAAKVTGRTGFGSSYGATGLTQDILTNAGAAMGASRHAKNRAIYGEREDWVGDLYNMFEYIASLGGFETDPNLASWMTDD